MKRHCAPFAFVLLLSMNPIQSAELLSGPVVGHTTTVSAQIWVETDQSAEIRISYW